MEVIPVGTITALNRFPVKSMAGQKLEAVPLNWYGFDGDRRYAFVQSDNRSGFPWLTGRQLPDLLRYRPSFVDPMEVNKQSRIRVQTPDGRELALEEPALREELAAAFGGSVQLLKLDRGAFDSMTLSLLSLVTTENFEAQLGRPVSADRFRANLVFEPFEAVRRELEPGSSPERRWLGRRLRLGGRPDAPVIRLDRPIQRCLMINLNPETAERDPDVLKTVAQVGGNCAGVYASTERPGTVQLGDTIHLLVSR